MQKHTVEFNQVAMANSEGSEAMLNRVMTKDNIGVAVVLEVHKELFGASEYDRGYLMDWLLSSPWRHDIPLATHPHVIPLPLAVVTEYLQISQHCSLC